MLTLPYSVAPDVIRSIIFPVMIIFPLATMIIGLILVKRLRNEQNISLIELNEKKFRLLIENTHDIVYTIDLNGVFTFVSPSWTELLGHPTEQVVGKNISDFIYPEDLEKSLEIMKEAYSSGKKKNNIEYRVRHLNGTWRWHLTNGAPLRDDKNNIIGYEGCARDITDKKKADEALEESEAKFKNLAKTAPIAILMYQNNVWIYANEIASKISGYSNSEILNMNFWEFIHPNYQEAIKQWGMRRQAGDELENNNYEFVIITKSKVEKWVQLCGKTIFINNKPAGMIILEDITERKENENKLKVAQLQWNQFLEASPDPTWLKDSAGKYVATNNIYYSVDKDIRGSVIGKIDSDFLPAEKAELFKTTDKIAIDNGIFDGKFQSIDWNGKIHYYSTKKIALKTSEGIFAGILGVSRDITELEEAENRTKIERAFFDQLIESSPEGIVIVGIDRKIIRASEGFTKMFDFTKEESVGKDIIDLIVPKELKKEAEDLFDVVRVGERTEKETKRTKKDGTIFEVNVLWAPIYIDGKEAAIYILYSDITQIKREETARKRAEEQLIQAQKMEAIGELAGGIAHDFNNILTGILGNIYLAKDKLPEGDPCLSNLSLAENAANQAAELTKGLLTFGRSAVILPISTNASAAIDYALSILKQTLPATIEIITDYEQPSWNIFIDKSQITQILLNLAINARDAMSNKGQLVVKTRNTLIREEYVKTHPVARTGEFVHLSVIDNGPGIPKEIMEHIFEPFHTTKPTGYGTGLGLSIVYGAVKQAGGWIFATNMENNAGTIFDIYLPRCTSSSVNINLEKPIFAPSYNNTILVVEDDPMVIPIVQAFLLKAGYKILTANNGIDAIKILEENSRNIDLIMLDMTMPGMNTDEIVNAIAKINNSIPILLDSGYTQNRNIEELIEKGVIRGFLAKPFKMEQLLDKIKSILHD